MRMSEYYRIHSRKLTTHRVDKFGRRAVAVHEPYPETVYFYHVFLRQTRFKVVHIHVSIHGVRGRQVFKFIQNRTFYEIAGVQYHIDFFKFSADRFRKIQGRLWYVGIRQDADPD